MTWSHVYRDYWGAHVTAMEAIGDHTSLEVEATSTVERSDSVAAADRRHVGWTSPTRGCSTSRTSTSPTPSATDPGDEIVELAQEARGPRLAARHRHTASSRSSAST